MILHREQIIFIDNYLKEKGISYWDIRLEMIDHIASKMEENEEIVLSKEFLSKEFGSNYQINKTVRERCKSVNKKYRKQYFSEVKSFFLSIKNNLIFFILIFSNYLLFSSLEYSSFRLINTIILVMIALVPILLYSKSILKKNRSINLEYASFYFSFGFIILQALIQFASPKSMFNAPIEIQVFSLLILTPIILIVTYCGYKVYIKASKKYNDFYSQLKSL